MRKKIIVTKQQLNEYIKKKRAEKTFHSIIHKMYDNSKHLSENISLNNANELIIENARINKQLTSEVEILLKKRGLISKN